MEEEEKPCCYNCQFEGPVKNYPTSRFPSHEKEDFFLCELCAHTMLSSATQYANQWEHDGRFLAQGMAYIGNKILAEISELKNKIEVLEEKLERKV